MRLFVAIFIAGFLAALASESVAMAAAQRRVHFSAAGQVKTLGVETPLAAECVLTITNAGPNSQTFDLNVSTSAATNANPGAYNGSLSLGYSTGLSSCTHSTTMANCVLLSGESAVVTYRFPQIPADGVVEQFVTCSGVIRVKDTADNAPGFIVANGSLMTFLPTTQQDIQIRACPTCNIVFRPLKANVAFSQVQILIGEGRPF